MHRLFVKIYLMVLASLVLFGVLTGISWKILSNHEADNGIRFGTVVTGLVSEILPPDASRSELERALNRWRDRLAADLALYDANGSIIAQTGDGFPVLAPEDTMRASARRVWRLYWREGMELLPLEGGRFLGILNARPGHFGGGPGSPFGVLGMLVLIGVAVAVAAWFPARRLTRRFESLQKSVDAFGAGDLNARAHVRGRDELGGLARHFNQTADRVAALMLAQRSLLANASHELRSPLARIRVAVELLMRTDRSAADRDRTQAELLRNVGELDELVDEVLMASRLQATDTDGAALRDARSRWDACDLGGLLAEECARVDLEPDTGSLDITGDTRLLRRMIRNLLENALRHGGDRDSVRVGLSREAASGLVRLSVCDRGPGVPQDERERIFEPFYRARGASEKSGGVGLGLALVRQIARHHGGDAVCLAHEGGGSCFEVSLPFAAPPPRPR